MLCEEVETCPKFELSIKKVNRVPGSDYLFIHNSDIVLLNEKLITRKLIFFNKKTFVQEASIETELN